MKTTLSLAFILLIFIVTNSRAQSQDATPVANNLPEKASIAGMKQGEITKDQLLNTKELTLDKDINSTCHISTFKMTLACKDSDVKAYVNEVNGNLTDVMRNAIRTAGSGCKIFFEYIKCVNNANKSLPLAPLSFILK